MTCLWRDDVIATLADSEAGQVEGTTARRAARRARAIAIICRTIAALPARLWPPATRIIRSLWPGFARERNAR